MSEPAERASAEEVLFDVVRSFLAELGAPPAPLAPAADLERDLGLGSLERAELLARVEQAFAVRLPDSALVGTHTPASLLELVERSGGPVAVRPIAAVPDPAAAPPAARGRLPERAQTLVEVARFRAEADGDRLHVRLPDDDGGEATLTFAELWEGALRVGTGLGGLGLRPGDRVVLMLAAGVDFFRAFLGVLCAGGVPVPIYPPLRAAGLGDYLDRQARLLDNARPSALVAEPALAAAARLLTERTPGRPAVSTVAALAGEPSAGIVRPSSDDLGLIQYTSGSTGDPKGVALSHRAMLANIRAIGRGLAITPDDVAICWLPLYHDMGLIGNWLTALYHGIPTVVLSPLSFLNRPERWLWAFHRYRGTASPAPNFAFDLCARKIPDAAIEGLDLSSWRAALCGAEPVRAETLERFIHRFAPYGFRREAMMPVYGLAETSVALTITPPGRGPLFDRVERASFLSRGHAEPSGAPDALTLVGSGRPIPGHEVRVVDPDALDRELPERRQGRILFRSPARMEGYYRRPEATAAVRAGDWIDTGDLGYLADGELYVTGRIKDLVIKGGRKYHPQDIERAAQRVAGVRQGCVVAFDAPSERGETIVVAAETAASAAERERIVREVIAAVGGEIGTPPDQVLLVPPRTIPKTSSGKLQRREARARYIKGDLVQRRRPGWLELAAVAVPSLARRAMARARIIARGLFGIYAILVLLPILAVTAVVVLLGCRRQTTCWRVVRGSFRLWGRLTGLLPRRSGAELPSGGSVLVSNHGSYLDSLVLIMASERPIVFTAKQEVYSLPVVSQVMRRMSHLSVDRGSAKGRLESYAAMADCLREGQLVHIFPEGTFTRTVGVHPFRLGAFHLAAEEGRPVVPLAIRGARQALPDGAWLPRPSRIEVEFLDPLYQAAPGFREIVRLRDRARQALARASAEPLRESAAG
jgi:1-acyl-sn-glycerol-3-phosphate acyltransferase